MVAGGAGEEGSWAPPPPALSTDVAPSFTFYFRCHGFRILGESRVEAASASPASPEEGKQPPAGFPVLRALGIYRVRERAAVRRSASNSILIFFLFMSFLKYTVHHLGSVHVTKNSPGISWSGEESEQLAGQSRPRASSSAYATRPPGCVLPAPAPAPACLPPALRRPGGAGGRTLAKGATGTGWMGRYRQENLTGSAYAPRAAQSLPVGTS